MSVATALSLMIQFGSFIVALLSLVVAVVLAIVKRK
ncbi:putative holin-like toxin [Alicyclobacillus kakegawensis]|nr:putative holin-like toxin [Alicyclobacillus kakegawensis]